MSENIQLRFTGSIPQNYDDHLGPMFFEPYAQEVGQLIKSSVINDALEIACGTGRLTRHLRKSLPSGAKLVASDLSTDMLDVAQEKLKGQNIDWRVIDAQDLPFEDDSFDLVVCYFGFMMVPDTEKAFAEVFRVLRKGGMLLMATWDKLSSNDASNVFRVTLKRYIDVLPKAYKLPFSMHDSELIIRMLQGAGFSNIQSERISKMSVAESSEKAAHGLVRGGSLYNEIVKRDPALIEEITTAVEKELASRYGRSPMTAPMSAIISRATK